MKYNIKELSKCLENHFDINQKTIKLTDLRKWYSIPISHIFFSIFFGFPLLRKPSLLSLDHLLKKDYTKNFFKCKRKMIASDTTIMRNLASNFKEEELFEINKQIVKKNYEYLKNPMVNKTVGIFDGSVFGNVMEEIMIICGKINQIIAYEPIEKKGKETAAAKTILQKVAQNYIDLKIDIILGDALYYSKYFFNKCKELFNANLLVKFSKPSINVIKEALIYFDQEKNSVDVDRISGFDSERLINYTIETVRGLKADTIDYKLSVSRITEENVKTGKKESFYVVTNDLTLKNEEIRDLSHLRWQIENNTFKEMNKIFSSKKKYTKNKKAAIIILTILFMFFNFFMYYLFSIPDKEAFGIGKTVILDILQLLYESLICYTYYYDSG